jgi:adenylate cyclase
MPRILIVDDEEDQEDLILQKFGHKDFLRDYQFLYARNGLEALEAIREFPDIDIALVDINMPEMDGLTLLEKSKEYNPLLKAIIVSAYGDMSNIRIAMNRGAFDFLTKPI